MSYYRLITETGPGNARGLAECLEACGALAVSIEDAGDRPRFDNPSHTTPLWTRNRVSGLFAAEQDPAVLRRRLGEAGFDPQAFRLETLEDADWSRVWMERYRPLRFGERLWVCPSWCAPPAAEGAVVVSLDPGLAFGTGTHASTALCLEWLARHPPAGGDVLDYGCGSGILAIAALKLGAARAVAVDVDPQALQVTRTNAAANGVTVTTARPGELAPELQTEVVLANILAEPLMALAPQLTARVAPGGVLLLAGLLATQADAVRRRYERGFTFTTHEREEWVLLEGRRRPTPGTSGATL